MEGIEDEREKPRYARRCNDRDREVLGKIRRRARQREVEKRRSREIDRGSPVMSWLREGEERESA